MSALGAAVPSLAILVSTTVTAVLLGAGAASAHFCVSACGGTGMQCGRMAVQVGKGCRLVCKATFPDDAVARRACADDCYAQVATDRAACETGITDCRAICDQTMNEECADDVCSVALNQCRDDVRAATRACTKAAGSDGAAIQSCLEPGDAMLGLGRAALQDCIDNATSGLSTCIAGCG